MCLGEGVGSGSPDHLQISNVFKLNYEIPKNMPRTPPPFRDKLKQPSDQLTRWKFFFCIHVWPDVQSCYACLSCA